MKKIKKGREIGKKKIINDFNRFINLESFKKKVFLLREQYDIPLNGIKPDTDHLGKKIVTVFYPRKWAKNKNISKEISINLRNITDSFPLKGFEWDVIFSTYLFYNYVCFEFMEKTISEFNLCKIADLRAEYQEYEQSAIIDIIANEKEKSDVYPIAIKITPYVSRNVIVNFIKENLELIKSLQEKYKDPSATLGKTRSRTAMRKHNFIYKSRNKPRKIIAKLTDRKFGSEHRPENMRVIISRKIQGG